ncbi:hypothetical protein D9M71_785810 [compost metagenome]
MACEDSAAAPCTRRQVSDSVPEVSRPTARILVFSQVASASSALDFLSEEKSCAANVTLKPRLRAWAGATAKPTTA